MDDISNNRRLESLPLTEGQVGIWLMQMLDPEDPCWNIGECIEIRGHLDERLFERALRHVLAATDAMHLKFAETDTGPVQYFDHDPFWELIREDFSSTEHPEQSARNWMMCDMGRPFRLDGGNLYRFALLRISDACSFWYAVNHHIINDGVGWRLLHRRVSEVYSALIDGKPMPPLPDTSWREIVADQMAYRNSEHCERDRRYWLDQLVDAPAPVTLSGALPERPVGYAKATGRIPHTLDLEEVAQRHVASSAVLIVAAAAIYIHRMTGVSDMLIGMPLAARVGAKMRSIVGVAANALPLRIAVAASDSIGEVIARTARGMRGVLRHQRYRAEDLRRDLNLSPSAPDICGTYVNYTPFEHGIKFGDYPAVSNPLGNWRVEDLQFVYYGGTDPDGQRLDVIGNPKHYSDTDLAEHARRFVQVLEQLAGAVADISVADIDLLTSTERVAIEKIWNDTGRVVLNDRLELVPFGATGELHVVGAGSTVSSSGRDKSASESFVASLFGSRTLIHGTGDLARWNPDGVIEFRGRLDRRTEAGRGTLAKQEVGNDGAGQRRVAALRTATELTLAEIWSEVLRCPILSRTDDFFQLGGDSLRTIQVMTRVKRLFSINLPLATAFEARTLEAFAECIDRAGGESGIARELPVLLPAPVGVATPLSFSQQRMWTIQSLDPLNTAYNMSTAARLKGEIDHHVLSRAIDSLLLRHEILRTTYRIVDGVVLQRVQPFTAGSLVIADLTVAESNPEEAALAIANEIAATPIDLENGPIFAIRLMRTGVDDHVLHFLVHHIAGDQWSLGVIGRELATTYNALLAGRTAEVAADSLGYRDFAIWEREHLGGGEIDAQLEYWRRKLADVMPLELPIDKPRPRLPTLRGSYVQVDVPDDLFLGLEQLGRRESATLFMAMFAGYAALLSRMTDQRDIAIGVPVANRWQDAVEKMVGTFVNFLVLRVDLSDDPTFSELVARVRAVALEAFAHQSIPFDRLVQELVASRSAGRAPLTQVMFNLLNAPLHGLDFDGVAWEPIELDRGGAQFEISVSVDRQVSGTITVEYNTDLFEKPTIERFIQRYLNVLAQAAAAPATRLSELDLLVEDERRLVLGAWNETSVEKPLQAFITMFEARAAAQPEAPAVTFGDRIVSYGELDSRANALANELVRVGVGCGSTVGVCVERSVAMVVALLAVQKSGGAYVPLDPELPADRLAYMMSDSRLGVIVMSARTSGTIDVLDGIRRIEADAFGGVDAGNRDHTSATPPARTIEPSDPAYVIYTSGSTGRPKGVVVPHGALSNFLTSMQREPGLRGNDVLAAVTTISFDIAALELYLPLLAGGRIELVPTTIASDGVELARLITDRQVNVMQATPATWRMLLEAGWQGDAHFRALCGGEPLPRELAEAISHRVGELWNLYGPTETTIWSTAGRVERDDDTISIGRPIDNTQIYVLNGQSPCPVGVVGEICIGGDGVAIGYLGRPDLTEERFVADPFARRAGARLYRTGDLGRWGADGRLYHLGRMDHQIKIRGFRVETGEIEAVLNEHPAVRQSIVVTRQVVPGDVRLVAYILYQGLEELTISEVRRYLRTRLPEYMIPAFAVPLDAVPLSASGKIDRNALPDPFDRAVNSSGTFEEPTAGLEAAIADQWRQLLKVKRVGADDNFFDLGGDSLLALRFVAGIEREIGTRIDPRNLFFQNLRQIAAAVGGQSRPREHRSP